MEPSPEPIESEERPRSFSVERVRPRAGGSSLSVATGAVALLVALAVIKPWGAGTGSSPSRPPRAFAPATAALTPLPTDDSPDGLAAPICLGAGAWRLASLETWRTQDVRVWRAVEPVADATGPLDPAIPSVPIVAIELGALGWCAPAYGPGRPVGPAWVTAWFVGDDGARELSLRQARPPNGTTPLAALYQPLGQCDLSVPCPSSRARLGARPWVSGRVVFRYEDLGAGRVSWFAADILVIPAPAAPEPSLGPAG